jgi:DNA-binding transcriptional ArsR family regulator
MADDRQLTMPTTEIFKALGDPIRWSIVSQMALVDELACLTLEETLPVSKPTISYHTKILYHAGLISARKEGRNYFYSLRRDVLHELLDSLRELGPTPRNVISRQEGYVRKGKAQDLVERAQGEAPTNYGEAPSNLDEALVLTW